MSSELLYFNGINGATGEYLLLPQPPDVISQIAQGETLDQAHIKELKFWYQRLTQKNLGPKEGVNPKDLSQAGWGVIFAFKDQDKIPAIKDALSELLRHRAAQATREDARRYKEYIGPNAYRPGESKIDFLARHGMGPGPADPDRVPYYLLIVGDPETIPYRFQYQLDVQYAVGRIYFDTLEEYAQYAHSVVMAETGQVALPRTATFFGVQNPNDTATDLSATQLVAPLADKLTGKAGWQIHSRVGEHQATKAQLGRLLGGDDTPALLFTASHGMGFPKDDPRQLPHQGALLCQDWPGPEQWTQAIPEEFYFAAQDVTADAHLLGLMAFHFACYGAGTPRLDDFAHQTFGQPVAIAPHAFVAGLPQRLLGHPKGGALAVVGHVERAWGYSFLWEKAGAQLGVFESTIKSLMDGHRLGFAIEYFNTRYAELSTDLNTCLEDIKFGKRADDLEVAGLWTANNDARAYVIIGDPAVQLPVVDDAAVLARPVMESIRVLPAPLVASPAAGSPSATPLPTAREITSATETTSATEAGVTPQPHPSTLGVNTNSGATTQPAKAGERMAITSEPVIETDHPAQSASTEHKRPPGDPDLFGTSFGPPPIVSPELDTLKQKHPDLYSAYVENIKEGYKNNDRIFASVLRAFLFSHYSTVIMYWVLFVVGVSSVVAAIVIGVLGKQAEAGWAFAGLSAVAFISYFIGRSTQSVEENLVYMTWLGVIYNSYWTNLAWTTDRNTALPELAKATAAAIGQLNALLNRQAKSTKGRFVLSGTDNAPAPEANPSAAQPNADSAVKS